MTLDRMHELPGRMFLNGSTIKPSLNEALAEGHSVRFGSGMFDIDGSTIELVDVAGIGNNMGGHQGQTIAGLNRYDTGFFSDDLSIPIISVDGPARRVCDLELFFTGDQPEPETTWADAVAIDVGHTFHSTFERIIVPRAGYAIKQRQAVGAEVIQFFSNSVRDFYCLSFTESAIHLKPSNGGNTGNVFSNVYLMNNYLGTPRECLHAIRLEETDGSHFQQVNIEHMDCQQSVFYLLGAANIEVSSLHYENVSLINDYTAMFSVYGERCGGHLSGMDFYDCHWAGSDRQYVFKVDLAARLAVDNSIIESNSDKTATYVDLVGSSDATGAVVEVRRLDDAAGIITDLSSGVAAASPPVIRRWNDNHYDKRPPLYTLTGYTATLPPGETAVANYATIAAFEAAVIPTYSGQRCQLADGAEVLLLEARDTAAGWAWVQM